MSQAPAPARSAANSMSSENRLKLGLFGANCSGGMAATNVPERWDGSWESNLALARMADEAGLEFLLPIARWRGYDGDTGFQNKILETATWATGLLASTRKITVFATVHTAFFHPLVAAKQIATMDQIGGGRAGLNIVCGWNDVEYGMLGLHLPLDSADRYAYGQEWYDILRRIWSSDTPFDWDGKYFQLKQVISEPKLNGGTLPPTINAGASSLGRDFGARNADVCFVVMSDLDTGQKDVAAIKAHAKGHYDRDVEVFTNCYVVCRPTVAQAQDYHHYYVEEQADWPAAEQLMASLGMTSKSFPPEFYTMYRSRFAAGHGAYPIVGDPDHVADQLEKVSQAGYAGTTISFVNYLDELPYFRDEVLPRLQAKGLRA